MVKFEEACPACGGGGRYYPDPKELSLGWRSCGRCGGRGWTLTEAGRELLSFLNRWADRIELEG